MVLQAYIDDSGNEPTSPVFVLAGFIATYERWGAFSDEWQAALDEPPGAAYFKMSEAESLRDEFSIRKGWTESKRDDRLITLARIITKYVAFRVHTSIRHEYFTKHIKSLRTPKRISPSNNPYFLLFHQLMLTTAAVRSVFGMTEPVDFFFDTHGSIGDDAVHFWDNFERLAKSGSSTDFTPYLSQKPTFRDEKQFKPLQAADLYAWQLRRNFVENRALYMPPRRALVALQPISPIGFDFGEEHVREFADDLAKARDKFIAENPDTPLYGPGEKKSETFKKAENRARQKNC
jgi:hypothetical protein